MFARLASRTGVAAVVAALALAASAGSARADYVDFSGARTGTDPVSFSGRLELGPITGTGATTSAVLKITLTNTTSTGDAKTVGYITGFGFNVPDKVTASAPVVSDSDFKLLANGSQTTTLQGGAFDYAFSTNATQLHTVNTNQIALGLAAGATATFQVTLTGDGVTGLTAAKLINEYSADPGVRLSARFRSTNTTIYKGSIGDGDKVQINTVVVPPPPPPPPPGAVPAPPGILLAGMGFGALLLRRRMGAK